jgi:hypothetical protein
MTPSRAFESSVCTTTSRTAEQVTTWRTGLGVTQIRSWGDDMTIFKILNKPLVIVEFDYIPWTDPWGNDHPAQEILDAALLVKWQQDAPSTWHNGYHDVTEYPYFSHDDSRTFVSRTNTIDAWGGKRFTTGEQTFIQLRPGKTRWVCGGEVFVPSGDLTPYQTWYTLDKMLKRQP